MGSAASLGRVGSLPSAPAEDPAAEVLGLATSWFPSHWENGVSYHFLSCLFEHL